MRTLAVSAGLWCVLVLAAPAVAQSEMPTELWKEYPLVQTVERTETGTAIGPLPDIGPLLPPDPEAAPASDGSARWSVWLVLLGLGAVALLFAVRTAPPVAASGARALGNRSRRLRAGARARPRPRSRPVQLREPAPLPRAPVSKRQYAPPPPVSVPEPDVEREPRRFVMRRTGLLRSRFVVVEDEAAGRGKWVARSRAFWSVGGHERGGAEAWTDFVDDLVDAGWEPYSLYSPHPEYYTLLRRIDEGTSALAPTIEAYSLAADDSDEL